MGTAEHRAVRPMGRDLLLAAAGSCAASAIVLGRWADVDGTVVLVGPLSADQVQILLWSLTVVLAGSWVIARCWVRGGPPRPFARVLATGLTVVTIAAVAAAEVLALLVYGFSTVNVHARFDVPSTGDSYVLVTQQGLGGSAVGLYRGGPVRVRRVPVDLPGTTAGGLIADGRLHVERADDGSPVLVYPTSQGDARVPLP